MRKYQVFVICPKGTKLQNRTEHFVCWSHHERPSISIPNSLLCKWETGKINCVWVLVCVRVRACVSIPHHEFNLIIFSIKSLSCVFIPSLMVNNSWPTGYPPTPSHPTAHPTSLPTSLPTPDGSYRLFSPSGQANRVPMGGVQEWSGLSNYYISSLSSCFLGPNNSRVHKSGLRRPHWCLWMISHTEKKKKNEQNDKSLGQSTF